MVWAASFMLAAAVGAYYFPQQPWIGIACGVLGFGVFISIVTGEEGIIFPAMSLAYYGITLAFFSPYREALFVGPLAGTAFLFLVTPKQIELVYSGFSLFGKTRPLSRPIAIYNPIAYAIQSNRIVDIISGLACAASAIFILEMIAR